MAEERNKTKQNETKRNKRSPLSALDWSTIREAVEIEGVAIAVMARAYGVSTQAISNRKARENWTDPSPDTQIRTTEDLLNMRNMRAIGRILKSMEKKLAAAGDSAAADADEIGKHARAVQSLARAAEVTATTKRKIKAHERGEAGSKIDRQALEAKLTRLAEKLERAELRAKPDG